MADGFLSRWSRRKRGDDAEGGRANSAHDPLPPSQPVTAAELPPPVKPVIAANPAIHATTAVAMPQQRRAVPLEAGVQQGESKAATDAEDARPLTLDDVKALTAESDFSAFAARHVAPDVRNAAMKKLFADPHFNIMDRLDIYIDDYSRPDPIPASMLRQLASAKFLKLFDDDDDEKQASAKAKANAMAQVTEGGDAAAPVPQGSRDVADDLTGQTVAHSPPVPAPAQEAGPGAGVQPLSLPAVPLVLDHVDPDLRLQQDHAAPGRGPGDGTR